MIRFLIETDKNGLARYDFQIALLETIEMENWLHDDEIYSYRLVKDLNNVDFRTSDVPIGSVEFVLEYLLKFYNMKLVKPLNIPDELNEFKFTKRQIVTACYSGKARAYRDFFIKEADVIKGAECGIIEEGEYFPTGKNLLVSTTIDIDAEFRVFVYHGDIIDIRRYSGHYEIEPDVDAIRKMVSAYTNCPPAYTIDVGTNKEDGTFVIEVHNFFSCGLYGFDFGFLPNMFIEAFRYMTQDAVRKLIVGEIVKIESGQFRGRTGIVTGATPREENYALVLLEGALVSFHRNNLSPVVTEEKDERRHN